MNVDVTSRLGVFEIITGYRISWTLAGFKDLRQTPTKRHLHGTAPARSLYTHAFT